MTMTRFLATSTLLLTLGSMTLAVIVGPAITREQYAGQFDNLDPAVRYWFQNYRNSKTGKSCCGEADCHILGDTDWGIENGQYYLIDPFSGPNHVPVPAEAVVTDLGNPTKNAVGCWTWVSGVPKILCFTPGVLI